jgi:gluconolactonase
MRFSIFTYLVISLFAVPAAKAMETPSGNWLAAIDLTTNQGVALVQGEWRYSDVELLPITHRAPDSQGQPTGTPVKTWDVSPHAGTTGFDDSKWARIAPDTLQQRRGNGRLSFSWYRIAVTVPEKIDAVATKGSTLVFETSIDDYAEVWVDGELPRATGQSGGSVIKGWNGNNRLIVGRNVQPGQKIQLAVFGGNGPLSDPPANFIWMRSAKLELYPGSDAPLAVVPQEVNVRIERADAALDAIVPANPKIFKLAEGFQFTEGPVWDRAKDRLLFSDPNANSIYAYDEAHDEQAAALSVFRTKSGYEGADIAEYHQPGSNGLTFDKQGRLTIDQHGNRRVIRIEDDGAVTVLAEKYKGQRLNSPNDLVYKSDGAIYFTDPPFGLPKVYDDPRKELAFSGVYRASKGKVTLVTNELKGPNGIAFSPDERVLYVGNWDPEHKIVLRLPVQPDGSVGKSEVFADVTREVPGDEALDGIKVDMLGNVYLSSPDGVRIYAPSGKYLGKIVAPRPIHNFAWGGKDGRTLYLCGRDRLYRIQLLVEGVRP